VVLQKAVLLQESARYAAPKAAGPAVTSDGWQLCGEAQAVYNLITESIHDSQLLRCSLRVIVLLNELLLGETGREGECGMGFCRGCVGSKQ